MKILIPCDHTLDAGNARHISISKTGARQMVPGERLRSLREKLGLTLKDVENATVELARRRENPKYWISQSRLCHIENGILPNIYRLQALALIYKRPLAEVLEWYGIDQELPAANCRSPMTHLADAQDLKMCDLPVRIDPLFNERRTSYIRRMIQEWGTRSVAALQTLESREFTYGYVGTEDYTLYPLVLPGSFLQIDPRCTEIEHGPWSSDLQRPIYFLETHDSYLCAWCAVVSSREIQVQPHALSGLPARTYKRPSEIEVVGRVVGIATKISSQTPEHKRENAAM